MKLKYFCEGCGREVPRNSKRCPYCGRFFSSVQCPRCGFQGESRDFVAGCPSCGYLKLPESGLKKFDRFGSKAPAGPSAGSPLLYRIIGIALALILAAFLLILFLRGAFS